MKIKSLFALLFLTLLGISTINSQVNYNKEAWGFEIDEGVVYQGGKPSDIVTAWTQDPGFTLSTEQKHSGKYSCKMDFTKSSKTGKFQTWRSKRGKQGEIEILSEKSYTVSAWFYIPSGKPSGRLALTIQKSRGKEVVASFNLAKAKTGEWTKLTAKFKGEPAVGSDLWSSVSYIPRPKTDLVIYLDDVTFSEK